MMVGSIVEISNMTLDNLLGSVLQVAPTGGRILVVTHGTQRGIDIPLVAGASQKASSGALGMLMSDRQDVAPLLGISAAQISALRDKMNAVRQLRLERVVIRACNIGQSQHTLSVVLRFFGARSINAPRVRDAFGRAPISFVQANTNAWRRFTQHPRTQIFDTNGGKFALRTIIQSRTEFRPEVKAESESAVRWWISSHLPVAGFGPSQAGWQPPADLLIHALEDPISTLLVFPRQAEFLTKLVTYGGHSPEVI
ncbi:MAG: hypothetical protein JSV86_09700 [Gemmatimonadota bacterium]|nr:MAG: hypothetical protein JSV86_09700 [Gemmatimonadota bacterium]